MPEIEPYPTILVPSAPVQANCGSWAHKIKCPFCPKIHTHGAGGKVPVPGVYGDRAPHCCNVADRWDRWVFVSESMFYLSYDVRPLTEDVDWAAEYRRGNRLVLDELSAMRAAGKRPRLRNPERAWKDAYWDLLEDAARKNLDVCLEHVKQLSK